MAAPAVPAASLRFQAVFPVQSLFLPDSNHGLDWNVFTLPGVPPSSFLQVPEAAASVAAISQSFVLASGPSMEQLEQRAFGWIILIVAVLLAAMQLIPFFHSYRTRLRALNFQVPVH